MASSPEHALYRQALREAERLRANVPTAELLGMANNGFILAEDELTEVVNRLGQRQRDLDELLSIAKTLATLAKKVKHLSGRLAPEVPPEEGGDG